MALPATDSFTNSDGTALPTHNSSWTEESGSFAINTNSLYSDNTATGLAYWNADTFSNDQYSKAVIAAVSTSGSGRMGLSCRVSSGNNGYYYWHRDFGATTRVLGKRVSGTNTDLDSDGTSPVANDTIEIRASGTSISALYNGSEVLSATDSALTSGAAGVFSDNNNATTKRIDDWEGGNLGAAGISIPVVMKHLKNQGIA